LRAEVEAFRMTPEEASNMAGQIHLKLDVEDFLEVLC
jgi:hypothetical protein